MTKAIIDGWVHHCPFKKDCQFSQISAICAGCVQVLPIGIYWRNFMEKSLANKENAMYERCVSSVALIERQKKFRGQMK